VGNRNIERVLPWRLSGPEKSVLNMLAHHCNDQTGACYPSVDTLASDTCLARRTVQRALGALKAAGAITATARDGIRTDYVINDPRQTDTGDSVTPVSDGRVPASEGRDTGVRLTPEREGKEEKRSCAAAPSPAGQGSRSDDQPRGFLEIIRAKGARLKTNEGDITQEWLDLAGTHGEQAVIDAMVKVQVGQRWPSKVALVLGPAAGDGPLTTTQVQFYDTAVEAMVASFNTTPQEITP